MAEIQFDALVVTQRGQLFDIDGGESAAAVRRQYAVQRVDHTDETVRVTNRRVDKLQASYQDPDTGNAALADSLEQAYSEIEANGDDISANAGRLNEYQADITDLQEGLESAATVTELADAQADNEQARGTLKGSIEAEYQAADSDLQDGIDSVSDAAAAANRNALDAAGIAQDKGTVYTQSAEPAGDPNGLWIDTGNGNVAKTWDGSSWVVSQDADIQNAAQAAATADSKAEDAQDAADAAQATADTKASSDRVDQVVTDLEQALASQKDAIEADYTAQFDDAADARGDLDDRISTNSAGLSNEITARSDETGALADRLDATEAATDANAADIEAEETARTDAQNAAAADRQRLEARLNNADDATLSFDTRDPGVIALPDGWRLYTEDSATRAALGYVDALDDSRAAYGSDSTSIGQWAIYRCWRATGNFDGLSGAVDVGSTDRVYAMARFYDKHGFYLAERRGAPVSGSQTLSYDLGTVPGAVNYELLIVAGSDDFADNIPLWFDDYDADVAIRGLQAGDAVDRPVLEYS